MEGYNKLVRDKIPKILEERLIPYEKRVALPEEYKEELVKKLAEEVDEFIEAGDIEELADVLEVIVALRNLPEYKDVETLRLRKREERGGFDERIILKGEK
jgi:predicted house-cleaning noncanonical NTP pyrophosphatase (MazG superfamily)